MKLKDKVLIVEDEQSISNFMSTVLEANGFDTLLAANGAQALVLGAFGCGAFRNDPAIVAQAYANILPEFRRHFRAIEFAVFCGPRSTRNYDAFRAIG